MYSLSDLTLYSPDVWLDLFESYNKNLWPIQLVTSIFGLSLFYIAAHSGQVTRLLAYLGLGGCWLIVGIVYHYFYFSSINWMAYSYATIFIIQGLLLIMFGVFHRYIVIEKSQETDKTIGISLVGLTLLIVPIIGLFDGRRWSQLDFFGVAPDSTALVTVGFLLVNRSNYRRWLMIVPMIWALVSFAGTWPFGMIQGLVVLSLILLCFLFAFLKYFSKNE